MAGWQDYNEQTNFLAQFLWSPEFSPKTVAETYKTRLPVIVKVTSGYDGCDGMHEFAMEEVYCIVDIKKQKRVVMTDISDRYISIPFDYHVKFHTVGANDKPEGPARPLSEICPSDSSSLNVNLRVMFEENQAVKFNDGADLGSKVQLGVIEYDEVYKERYLVCHPLQSNEILSDVVIIPIYVPISVSVAEGFVNAPPDSFSDWMRCIAASVQAFDTTSIQPCTEIVVFDESPASDYTYINPVNLFQHSLKGSPPQRDSDDMKRYLNITQCKEKQRGRVSILGAQLPPLLEKRQGRNASPSSNPSKATISPGPPLPPRNYTKEPSPEKDNPPVVPAPRKNPGSTSGQMKSPVTSSAPAKVKQDAKVTRTASPSKIPKSGATDLSKRPRLPTPVREQISTFLPRTGNATRFIKNVEDPAKEGSKVKEPPKKSVPSKPAMDYRSADAIQNKEKSVLSQKKPFKERSPLIEECGQLFKDSPSQCDDSSDLVVEYETLDEATVTLTPGDKVTKPSSGSSWKGFDDNVAKPSSGSSWKGLDEKVAKPLLSPGWKSIEDVPLDLNIRLLTVDELCRCLELLKMGRFAEQFRQRMVDGCLLLDLTNETLKEDFGMTLFDATKLMKFARDGWRPKTQ